MHLYHGRANAIHPYNNLLTQTEDILFNPQNPVNPDSKIRWKPVSITLKPVEEKTRGIESLRQLRCKVDIATIFLSIYLINERKIIISKKYECTILQIINIAGIPRYV